MINKIKLKDKLKSWLYTLGVASFACALGVCVSVSEKYQKACAYDYQDNGQLSFTCSTDDNISHDFVILTDYFVGLGVGSHNYRFSISDSDSQNNFDDIDSVRVSREGNLYAVVFSNSDYDYFQITFEDDNYSGSFELDFTYTFPITLYTLPSYEGYQGLRNYVLSYNAPQSSGNFVTALTSFMSLIGGGIVQLAQSVGAGVVSFASGLFLDSGHLSILGGIIGIFAGIALAVGITSKVYTWVSTLGN